ncbi:unnamed protein product [Mytilus coruscus]|uniref:Uncharacterized protein n=1 Tax=Mytilus coruscus TaxID=42192 RepID=A0A6J8A9Q5_MYTCO|nr:unnamed protein product [Mytilus coruscus]
MASEKSDLPQITKDSDTETDCESNPSVERNSGSKVDYKFALFSIGIVGLGLFFYNQSKKPEKMIKEIVVGVIIYFHIWVVMQMKKIRHDKAIEKLEKAQQEWNKRRTQRLDFINEQLQKEHHAEHTFEDVDQAMKQYYYITSKQLTPLSPKPKLSDFYTPSEDQKIEKLHLLLVEWF